MGRLARRVDAAFSEGGDGEDAEEGRRAAVEAFRRGVARGEHGELFDGGVRAAMAQAAREAGVAEEIGALRLALARLVGELPHAEDPVRAAHGVARVAAASVRAVERQHALVGGPRSELEASMMRALDELDAESAEQEARRAAGEPSMSKPRERGPAWGPPAAMEDVVSEEVETDEPRWSGHEPVGHDGRDKMVDG